MVTDGSLTSLLQQQYADINNHINEEINNVNQTITENYNVLSNRISSIANNSPTVVANVSSMTDTSKIYINSSDLNWYYYNGVNWVIGGKYQGDSSEINFINEYIGAYHKSSTLRSNKSSIQIDYNLFLANGENFEFNIYNFVHNNSNFKTLIIYGYNADDTLITIQHYGHNYVNHGKLQVTSDIYGIRIYIECDSVDTSISAESNIILYKNTNNITGKINEINNNLGENEISQTTQRSDGIFAQFDENVSSGENIYFYITKYSGNPKHFYLYGYETTSSTAENLFSSENINALVNKTQKITTTKNYVRFRCYLAYDDGTNETASFIFNHNDNSLIAQLYRLQNTINTSMNFAKDTYKIFKKVVCVGDSFTSGHIFDSQGVAHSSNPEFAWPHFMATSSGNEYVNLGISGANANTWLNNPNGLAKAKETGLSQAYIIGLGINDSSNDPTRNLTLGTSSDIGTNNVTFYGKYSQLIKELHAISPKAKIFVQTVPNTNTERYNPYNNAIRTIYNQYKDTYNCYLLDLADNIELYQSSTLIDDIVLGHYTALGYEQFAEILKYVLSNYINNNISDFQDVAFIPYI